MYKRMKFRGDTRGAKTNKLIQANGSRSFGGVEIKQNITLQLVLIVVE